MPRKTRTGKDLHAVSSGEAAVAAIEEKTIQARQALALRRRGLSVWEIAEELQISESSVRSRLDVAKRTAVELLDEANRAELLAMEVMRLDAVQAAHWDVALAGDVRSAQIVLMCIDKRARYLGLDEGVSIDARRQTVIVAGGEEEYVAALRRIQEVAG
jgi:DNA-binding CsgD family transcriptional regulator